jgi:hypothetical protein
MPNKLNLSKDSYINHEIYDLATTNVQARIEAVRKIQNFTTKILNEIKQDKRVLDEFELTHADCNPYQCKFEK